MYSNFKLTLSGIDGFAPVVQVSVHPPPIDEHTNTAEYDWQNIASSMIEETKGGISHFCLSMRRQGVLGVAAYMTNHRAFTTQDGGKIDVQYISDNGKERVVVDVYPVLPKIEEDEKYCMLVLYNGNSIAALIPNDSGEKFAVLYNVTLKESSWGTDRIQMTELKLDASDGCMLFSPVYVTDKHRIEVKDTHYLTQMRVRSPAHNLKEFVASTCSTDYTPKLNGMAQVYYTTGDKFIIAAKIGGGTEIQNAGQTGGNSVPESDGFVPPYAIAADGTYYFAPEVAIGPPNGARETRTHGNLASSEGSMVYSEGGGGSVEGAYAPVYIGSAILPSYYLASIDYIEQSINPVFTPSVLDAYYNTFAFGSKIVNSAFPVPVKNWCGAIGKTASLEYKRSAYASGSLAPWDYISKAIAANYPYYNLDPQNPPFSWEFTFTAWTSYGVLNQNDGYSVNIKTFTSPYATKDISVYEYSPIWYNITFMIQDDNTPGYFFPIGEHFGVGTTFYDDTLQHHNYPVVEKPYTFTTPSGESTWACPTPIYSVDEKKHIDVLDVRLEPKPFNVFEQEIFSRSTPAGRPGEYTDPRVFPSFASGTGYLNDPGYAEIFVYIGEPNWPVPPSLDPHWTLANTYHHIYKGAIAYNIFDVTYLMNYENSWDFVEDHWYSAPPGSVYYSSNRVHTAAVSDYTFNWHDSWKTGQAEAPGAGGGKHRLDWLISHPPSFGTQEDSYYFVKGAGEKQVVSTPSGAISITGFWDKSTEPKYGSAPGVAPTVTKNWWNWMCASSAVSDTPVFKFWMHVSNGKHNIQAFEVEGTPYIRFNRMDFAPELQRALEIGVEDVQGIIFDVDLRRIKELK